MQWLSRFFAQPEHADVNVLAMPIPPDRFAALRPDDQFIVSYPRSGNTWMRHLVRDVIVLSQPEKPIPESIWMLIPDVHIASHQMEHSAQKEFGMKRRILKSHHLKDIEGYRLLYLFREPADTLVSYYHFHELQKDARHWAHEGLDAFCEQMIDGWCEHVELALKYLQAAPREVLFISYESLVNEGSATVTRAVRFLGIDAAPKVIADALERNAFTNLRKKEEASRVDAKEFFFRKGRIGSGREELSFETLERIGERAGPIYERAKGAAIAAAQQ